MIIRKRTFALQDGRICVLRSPRADDAQALLEYVKITAGETDFLTKYPDEVTITPEEERDYIEKLNAAPRQAMIIAEADGELAGNCTFHPLSTRDKSRHRCTVGIALYRKFWGMGIAAAMFAAVFEEALACGFEQMELEVRARNKRAIALYKRMGFTETGRIPRAAKYRDGSCDDHIYMVKLL